MTRPMTTRSTLILEAAGFHLTLLPCGDRLAHTVGLVLPQRVVPLLASLEGSPDDEWPPSPPLTTVETLPGSSHAQALLLLGMAGRSHWSASIRISEPNRSIELEVACRIKEQPAWLGSSYRTMVAGEMTGHVAQLKVEDQTVGIAAVGASVHVTREGLKIAVAPPVGPFPQTVRWNYSVRHVS